MKDKPLNYRQDLFAEYYTEGESKGNAYKSAMLAGYKHKFALQAAPRLLENVRIKALIEGIKAKISKKIEHNFEIAANMLKTRIGWLDKKAREGNVQAIQAQAALIRELDDIAGLKTQNINVTTDQVRELDETESVEAAQYSKWRIHQQLEGKVG